MFSNIYSSYGKQQQQKKHNQKRNQMTQNNKDTWCIDKICHSLSTCL